MNTGPRETALNHTQNAPGLELFQTPGIDAAFWHLILYRQGTREANSCRSGGVTTAPIKNCSINLARRRWTTALMRMKAPHEDKGEKIDAAAVRMNRRRHLKNATIRARCSRYQENEEKNVFW